MIILKKLKELKDKSNLTSQQIAELSGVPLSTVNRIFSGQTDNPSFITVSDMVRAMGGSLDDLMADSDEKETPEKAKTEEGSETERSAPENYEHLIEVYRETIRMKNKWIRTLFWVCISLTAIIAFVLIYDVLNPQIGYIRY